MEYYSETTNTRQPGTASYFNKEVWLQYVHEMLPALPDTFKLTVEENKRVLKAYYQLLGVNTSDEYGWMCEYSTVGRPTERRMAVIALLEQHRVDLLRRLLEFPNLQTKLYAIDALIYNDNHTKFRIQTLEKEVEEKQRKIDSLRRLSKPDKNYIDYLQYEIKGLKNYVLNLNAERMTKNEWETVHYLRNSKQIVKTCGNAGSYKIYPMPIEELLSDKAIDEVHKHYVAMKQMGYFK